MGGLLDRIEQKRAILVKAKEGAERARKDVRKVCAVLDVARSSTLYEKGLCVGVRI